MLHNFLLIEKSLTKFKSFCLQISWFMPHFFYETFNVNVNILNEYSIFRFNLTLFGDFLNAELSHLRRTDHAGFTLDVTFIGLMFHFNIYDNRHWDYDNNTWEV